MSGKLYLVATPIGNLEDITLRALRVLKEVDIIAAEDTRHTLKLLNRFGIKKTLISYYKENERIKSNILIEKLKEDKNIALVSDAGTPAISDPGEEIVKLAIENNIEIIPIPGACAFINALICSGFDTKKFAFIGFLPVNKKEKKDILERIKKENKSLIFYEAPHKLRKTLELMLEVLGNRDIVLARELTKIHEEFIRGEPKGEFVIILKGAEKSNDEKDFLNKMTLEEHFEYYQKQGLEKKEIIKNIAKDRNTNKNEIYQYFIK